MSGRPAVTKDIPLVQFINMPGYKKAKIIIERHLVIINDAMMEKADSDEDRMSVIAHELAHVYKKHPLVGEEDYEKDADKIIKTWGFRPKIKIWHGTIRTKPC